MFETLRFNHPTHLYLTYRRDEVANKLDFMTRTHIKKDYGLKDLFDVNLLISVRSWI